MARSGLIAFTFDFPMGISPLSRSISHGKLHVITFTASSVCFVDAFMSNVMMVSPRGNSTGWANFRFPATIRTQSTRLFNYVLRIILRRIHFIMQSRILTHLKHALSTLFIQSNNVHQDDHRPSRCNCSTSCSGMLKIGLLVQITQI